MQERPVSPEGSKGYWLSPSLSAVSECGARCHRLWTRPHSDVTDKFDGAGQSTEYKNEAMRVRLETTKDTLIETMRFVLDLPLSNQLKKMLVGVLNPVNR